MGLDAPLRSGLSDEVRAEDRLRLALDTIPALLHSTEADGSLDYFNQRWLDYLGVPLDDIKGWGWISKIHPDDVDAFVKEWRSSLRTGEPLEAEARVRRQDGVYRWMLHRKVPLRDEQGKVVKWYGSSIDIDELKRSEFYLAEGQRLSHVGSWAFNPAGFEHWSSELFKIHGLDASAKAPGLEEYLALVHLEDRESVLQTIQKMSAEGRGFDFTKRIVRPDGKIRTVRCVGVPSTRGGTSQGFVGTGIDVTEQERILDELKRSEFYLAEGQRLSRAGSWSFKPDLTCDYWSRELYEILGFDPKNGIPTISDYFSRVHPEDRKVVEATIRRMIAAGEGCDLKKRIIRPDGVQRVIRCVGMAVREQGIVTRFVGTLMDITEQEELTQELRRREAYLAEAQRLSHTGSFGWNVVTGERTWSEETYRIYGYDPSVKPTLERLRDRVHPDDLQVFEEARARASEGKEVDFEYRLLMPDGSVKHLHAVAYGVQRDGKYVELVGTAMDITERKRAEETLRRSEAYLAEAQRLSHTGSWAWSPDTDVRYWSEECYRVLGFDPRDGAPRIEELIQRIHPDDQPAFRESARRATHTKFDEEVDYRIVHPGGAVRDIHSIGHPVFSPSGDLTEYTGTVIDVTERKRAEQTLRQSEAYLAEAQRLSQTGSWAWSPDQDIRYWSEECYRVLSFNPQDGLPRFEEFFQRIHPDDQPGFRELIQTAIGEKAEWEADYRIVHPGGAVRDIHVVGHPVLSTSGHLVEFVGTVIDVTERKRAEESIRRSEAFLAEGQRVSHTGSWGWNASTGKVMWSQEHFRILGLDPQQTNPSLDVFWERVHPDDRIGLRRTFESAIRDKRDFEQEFRIVRLDSSIRHLHGVGHTVLNKANELVEFIGTTMDITERKRAEVALQDARAELERVTRVTTMGELAASIAHEINQPLAGVVTSANAGLNWLAANPPNLSKTRETLERILRDGTRGGEVLARIRALLKRTPPAKTLVSVNQIVRDMLALVGGGLRQHHIELSLDLAPTVPAVLGDTVQLQQVLLNLIKNAVEAMSGIANGQRTLRIQSRLGELDGKPAVVVEVSDTGVGLSTTETTRLFEAFHTTKPQGMGMGLWISRSIIENHHGRLTASSNRGPGATFVIMLPKASQEQA
jgi:PAS domain S-box-containing protein